MERKIKTTGLKVSFWDEIPHGMGMSDDELFPDVPWDSPLGMIAAPRTPCSNMCDKEDKDAAEDLFQVSGEDEEDKDKDKDEEDQEDEEDEDKNILRWTSSSTDEDKSILINAGTLNGFDLEPFPYGMGPGSPMVALLGFEAGFQEGRNAGEDSEREKIATRGPDAGEEDRVEPADAEEQEDRVMELACESPTLMGWRGGGGIPTCRAPTSRRQRAMLKNIISTWREDAGAALFEKRMASANRRAMSSMLVATLSVAVAFAASLL